MSDSLRPHEQPHARPPCPSPTPGVHPNPYLLSWLCYPTILSSAIPFSFCPQSFPALGSFLISRLFAPVCLTCLPMIFFSWPRHGACRLLVLQPGIKPVPSALETWSSNRWTAGEFPTYDVYTISDRVFAPLVFNHPSR